MAQTITFSTPRHLSEAERDAVRRKLLDLDIERSAVFELSPRHENTISGFPGEALDLAELIDFMRALVQNDVVLENADAQT